MKNHDASFSLSCFLIIYSWKVSSLTSSNPETRLIIYIIINATNTHMSKITQQFRISWIGISIILA